MGKVEQIQELLRLKLIKKKHAKALIEIPASEFNEIYDSTLLETFNKYDRIKQKSASFAKDYGRLGKVEPVGLAGFIPRYGEESRPGCSKWVDFIDPEKTGGFQIMQIKTPEIGYKWDGSRWVKVRLG